MGLFGGKKRRRRKSKKNGSGGGGGIGGRGIFVGLLAIAGLYLVTKKGGLSGIIPKASGFKTPGIGIKKAKYAYY